MNEDNKKYWLNEWGLRIWTSKHDKYYVADRAYHWCDRVIFIDESEGRKSMGETTFTKFLEVEDQWHPMSKKQYDAMILKHREENNEFYTSLLK